MRFTFDARVAESGYRFAEESEVKLPAQLHSESSEPPRWIVENHPIAGRAGISNRQPCVESPLLYRSFADLPLNDPERILTFTNEWGFLLWGRPPNHTEQPLNNSVLGYSETLDLWRSEISNLAHAIRVNHAIREGDIEALSPLTQWVPLEEFRGRTVHGGWMFRSAVPGSEAARRFLARRVPGPMACVEYLHEEPWAPVEVPVPNEHDDPRSVATHWLDQQITYALRTATTVPIVFETNPRTGGRSWQIRTLDLCAALWSQFANSIAMSIKERSCLECKKWFILQPKDRGKKIFCSDACKEKNYRNKKKQVIDLYSQNALTVQAIAEQVKADVATVKKWVKVAKKARS